MERLEALKRRVGCLIAGIGELDVGVEGVDAVGGAQGVAAHNARLLKHDDAHTVVGGGDGGHETCAAGAHDDDIGLRLVLNPCLLDGGRKRIDIAACLLNAIGKRRKECVARQGRPAHRLNGQRLVVEHLLAERAHGGGANGGGLRTLDVDGFNRIGRERSGQRDVAIAACGGGAVGAGIGEQRITAVCKGDGGYKRRAGQGCAQAEKRPT